MMNDFTALIANVLRLPIDDVNDDTGTATTSAWTSLRHVAIIVRVEEAYGVKLTPREARTCRSVRVLRDVLAARGIAV